MKKTLLVLLVFIVLAAGVLYAAKERLVGNYLQIWVEEQTGFSLALDSLHIDLRNHAFRVQNAQLLNPPDFPERHAMDLDELYVDYDFRSLFSDRLHFNEIRLGIKRMTIVQKADGETNFDRLSGGIQQATRPRPPPPEPVPPTDPPPAPDVTPPPPPAPDAPPAAPAPAPRPKRPEKEFLIDTLTLSFGRGDYLAFREGRDTPRHETLELNRAETYRNVSDARQLFRQIAVQVALEQGMKGLQRAAREHADRLGIKPEEVDKVTEAIGGFLDRLR